jgi:hypothetical protein
VPHGSVDLALQNTAPSLIDRSSLFRLLLRVVDSRIVFRADDGIAHTLLSTAVAKSICFQLVLKIDQSEGNILPHT